MSIRFIEDNIYRIKRHLPFSHYNRVLARHRRILHDYRCIFIHIPKTAGDSITEALNALPVRDTSDVPRLPKHLKAREVKSVVGDRIWNDYFTFAFVRNPWDLMVSSYNWWLQTAPKHKNIFDPDVRNIRKMGGFTEFMLSEYGRTMINEYKGEMFDWISEDDKVIVDFVGKFESLGEDWRIICNRAGIEHIALPHVNRTERKPYRDYYTDETRCIVADRFKRTIEMFGYAF